MDQKPAITESSQKRIKNLLFLSLETVATAPSYEQLGEKFQRLWDRKAGQFHPEEIGKLSPRQLFTEKANLITELVAISKKLMFESKKANQFLYFL